MFPSKSLLTPLFLVSMLSSALICPISKAQPGNKTTTKLTKNQHATIRRTIQDVISIGGLETNGRPLNDEQMLSFAITWNYLRHEKRFTKLPNDGLRLSSKSVADCCFNFFGRVPRHKSLPQQSWKYRNGSYTGHLSDVEGLQVRTMKNIQLSGSNNNLVAVVTWIDDFGGETIIRDRIFLKSNSTNPTHYHVLRTQAITAR